MSKYRISVGLALCLALTYTLFTACRESDTSDQHDSTAIIVWHNYAGDHRAAESQIALSKIDLSQCDLDWRKSAFLCMSRKYFGEGNYPAALEWQLKQPDAMNHVIGGIFDSAYMARLAGDDAWLNSQLQSTTIDPTTRSIIQAQLLIRQHDYQAVVDTLKTEDPKCTKEELQWYHFLKAEALCEMKEYEHAGKECDEFTSSDVSPIILREMALLIADVTDGTGDTASTIFILEALKRNLVNDHDVSWNGVERAIDSRLAKLKAPATTSTSRPGPVGTTQPTSSVRVTLGVSPLVGQPALYHGLLL